MFGAPQDADTAEFPVLRSCIGIATLAEQVIGTAMTKGINIMPAIVPARKINK
jgi:hypothetical protein